MQVSEQLQIDFLNLFQTAPGNHLVLLPDAPRYTIVAASDDYLKVTYTKRENILNKGLFEVFPDNPALPNATGKKNLSDSLQYVIKNKSLHQMQVQRYDVFNPDSGTYKYKVFNPHNKPLLNADGDIQYIIHTIEDITDQENKLIDLKEKHKQSTEGQLKKADQELNQKQELLESTVNSSLDLIQVFEAVRDKDGAIVDFNWMLMNHAAQKWMGNVIGKSLLQHQPGVIEEGIFDTFKMVVETGIPNVEEIHYVHEQFNGWFQQSVVKLNDGVATTTTDISALKKAEEELRFNKEFLQSIKIKENEKQFRNVLLQSPNIFVILEGFPDMIITFANEPLFKSWGQTAEIIGKPLLEVLPELKEQSFPKLLQQVFETGETYYQSEEKAVLIKNGVPVDTYYMYVYQAIFDDYKKVTGVTIMATDITEQVTARRKIKESEAQYKSLIGAAPIGIGLLMGRDLILESANQKYIDLIGKGNDIEGKKFTAIMPELVGQPYLKILDDIFITGKSYQSFADPVSVIRNGILRHEFYDIDYAPLFDGEGKVYAILNIATDVTIQTQLNIKLKESEKQFRNVLLQSPNIFVILQGYPDMIITFANEPLFKSWGRTAEIIGKPLLEVLPELKEQSFPKLLQRVFETGETYYEKEEKAVIIKNGAPVDTYFMYVYQAILDDVQKVTGVTIMATDITEQVLSRKKVEESEKRFSNLLLESPFAVAILKGKDMVVALANDAIKNLWGKGAEIEGKPLLSLMPEIKEQGFAALLEKVYTTGKPFYGHEQLAKLQRNGIWEEVYFNFIYQPYREADETISGVTIIANEVTTQAVANKKIAASEQKVSRLFMETPAVICVLRGPQHVYELANEMYMQLIGKRDILRKPIREALPELEGQVFYELLDNVYTTGEPFFGNETPVQVAQGAGKLENVFLNFVYQPSHNNEGEIDGILVHAVDVTEQVLSRKKIEESEEQQAYLLKLSDGLRELTDPVEIQLTACKTLGEHIKASRVLYIEVIDEEWVVINNNYENGVAPIIATLNAEQFGRNVIDAFKRNEKVIFSDINTDARYDEDAKRSFLSLDVVANVGMGLVKGGKWVATFEAHYNAPRTWTEMEILLMEETAERTWAAVERAKFEEALRNSEERLQKVLSVETVGILYFNLEGVILDANTAFERMSGFSKEELVNGNIIWDELSLPGKPKQNTQSREEFIIKGQDTPCEKQYIKKDGSMWWGLCASKSLSSNEFVEFVVDINNQKEAEERLKRFNQLLEQEVAERTQDLKKSTVELQNNFSVLYKAEKELREANINLQHANKNLQQFATIASHDLQEPLRKLKMFASVLKRYDNNLPQDGKELIQKIHATSERMSQLIKEVLHYSKIAYGEKEFVPTDLNLILNNVLNDLELLISETGASIIHSATLPQIDAIPPQMNQLFYNLLTNAMKYRKEDESPVIRIYFNSLSADKAIKYADLKEDTKYIEIIIADNGIGFEQHYAGQIFQIFERLHSVDEYEGTGIGLALCKIIMENHSGHIFAESKEGEGSSFHILLPLNQ